MGVEQPLEAEVLVVQVATLRTLNQVKLPRAQPSLEYLLRAHGMQRQNQAMVAPRLLLPLTSHSKRW